jgi:hypothetical protein
MELPFVFRISLLLIRAGCQMCRQQQVLPSHLEELRAAPRDPLAVKSEAPRGASPQGGYVVSSCMARHIETLHPNLLGDRKGDQEEGRRIGVHCPESAGRQDHVCRGAAGNSDVAQETCDIGREARQGSSTATHNDRVAALDLVEGQPAKILISGNNLWRGTEVYVGAQKADQISLSQEMQSVQAVFSRIDSPVGSRVKGGRVDVTRKATSRPVRRRSSTQSEAQTA